MSATARTRSMPGFHCWQRYWSTAMVLALENWHEGRKTQMVDEERSRSVDDIPWVESVIVVLLSASTWLVWWQERHLTSRNLCHLSPNVFFGNKGNLEDVIKMSVTIIYSQDCVSGSTLMAVGLFQLLALGSGTPCQIVFRSQLSIQAVSDMN